MCVDQRGKCEDVYPFSYIWFSSYYYIANNEAGLYSYVVIIYT